MTKRELDLRVQELEDSIEEALDFIEAGEMESAQTFLEDALGLDPEEGEEEEE